MPQCENVFYLLCACKYVIFLCFAICGMFKGRKVDCIFCLENFHDKKKVILQEIQDTEWYRKGNIAYCTSNQAPIILSICVLY